MRLRKQMKFLENDLKSLEKKFERIEERVGTIEEYLGFLHPNLYLLDFSVIPPDDICLQQKLDAICKHLEIKIEKVEEKERVRIIKKKS